MITKEQLPKEVIDALTVWIGGNVGGGDCGPPCSSYLFRTEGRCGCMEDAQTLLLMILNSWPGAEHLTATSIRISGADVQVPARINLPLPAE
jgi:hypothetical protein